MKMMPEDVKKGFVPGEGHELWVAHERRVPPQDRTLCPWFHRCPSMLCSGFCENYHYPPDYAALKFRHLNRVDAAKQNKPIPTSVYEAAQLGSPSISTLPPPAGTQLSSVAQGIQLAEHQRRLQQGHQQLQQTALINRALANQAQGASQTRTYGQRSQQRASPPSTGAGQKGARIPANYGGKGTKGGVPPSPSLNW